MANRCYCGRSAAYPWCDGSHAYTTLPADPAAAEDVADPAPAAPAPAADPPRRSLGVVLRRLIGLR